MSKYNYIDKLIELDSAMTFFNSVKAMRERTVLTNGCFDVIHSGHVQYLRQSRMLGGCLVVAVNSDQSIRKLKGENRPINTFDNRIQVLSAFDFVDRIICLDDDTPRKLIEFLKPDIYTKGDDYTDENAVGNGLGRAFIEDCGGELVLIAHAEQQSSTNLIKKLGLVMSAAGTTSGLD